MIERPALAPSFAAYHAPGEGVFLLSAERDFLLHGELFEHLIPLLDGSATPEELCEQLDARLSAPEVWYGLQCLDAERALASETSDAGVEPESRWLAVRDLLDPAISHAIRSGSERRPLCVAESDIWIGPSFQSLAMCWECLEASLLAARPVAALVRERNLSRFALPHVDPVISQAQHDWLDADAELTPHDRIVSVDVTATRVAEHRIRVRRTCGQCHGRNLHTDPESLLDPITGLARGVRKLIVPGCDAIHVYVGGPNRGRAVSDTAALRRDLRRLASGKGVDDARARASLIGEVAERSSAVHRAEDTPDVMASVRELGASAIHPNSIMLFSDRQLEVRVRDAFDPIPERLTDDAVIGWSTVDPIGGGEPRYVPTGLLYLDYRDAAQEPFCIADSNGNAAGETRGSAILQGLLELIERDAGGIWWYAQTQREAIDLASLHDEWATLFVEQVRALGLRVHVLDISTDIGVPVCVAVALNEGAGAPRPLLGFGAHLTERDAARRALTELAQMIAVFADAESAHRPLAEPVQRWMDEATLESQPQLKPLRTRSVFSDSGQPRIEDAITWCCAKLSARGIETYVRDQTRDDIGVPVVKVIAPGLRHFRRRLAAGRLSLTEEQANQAVFPF